MKPPIAPPPVLSLDEESRRLISAYQLARTYADNSGPTRPIFKSNGIRLDQHPNGF